MWRATRVAATRRRQPAPAARLMRRSLLSWTTWPNVTYEKPTGSARTSTPRWSATRRSGPYGSALVRRPYPKASLATSRSTAPMLSRPPPATAARVRDVRLSSPVCIPSSSPPVSAGRAAHTTSVGRRHPIDRDRMSASAPMHARPAVARDEGRERASDRRSAAGAKTRSDRHRTLLLEGRAGGCASVRLRPLRKDHQRTAVEA
jgi:hypothetical protein